MILSFLFLQSVIVCLPCIERLLEEDFEHFPWFGLENKSEEPYLRAKNKRMILIYTRINITKHNYFKRPKIPKMLSSQSKFGYINNLPKMRQYKQTGYILSRVGAKIIDLWGPKS